MTENTTTTITATVTFADLRDTYQEELDDLREAYEDTITLIEDDYGSDALTQPLPTDPDSEDIKNLSGLRATADLLDESGKRIQRRNHALEQLEAEYGSGGFELAMLSGNQLLDIETELKMRARERGVDPGELEHVRKGLVVDAATVSAPEGVPTGDDDGPMPSECPNPLTLALYEQVEDLNQAGMVGFRAPGFGDPDREVSPNPASSAAPNDSSVSSSTSPPDVTTTPDSTDSS